MTSILSMGCGDSRSHDNKRLLQETVGERLFEDTTLSEPQGKSCASCHSEAFAFTDPNQNLPVSAGAQPGVFGRRQSLSLAYDSFVPPLSYDAAEDIFFGGLFWDGRADTLEDQAAHPLLNPLEMNNPNKESIVQKVAAGPIAADFQEVFGQDIFSDTDKAFSAILQSLASYERTPEFSPFTSKYDYFLERKATFTEQELRGFALFNDPKKGNCAACHPSAGVEPLFTDFTFDNLGVPKNPNNPFYTQSTANNPDGSGFIDIGLVVSTGRPEDRGKMKVPSLRNIAKTAPYFHNGVFSDLETVVNFYNRRDTGIFGPPEIFENVNRSELGNLGLNDQEVKDIAVFLRTLSDGYDPTSGQ